MFCLVRTSVKCLNAIDIYFVSNTYTQLRLNYFSSFFTKPCIIFDLLFIFSCFGFLRFLIFCVHVIKLHAFSDYLTHFFAMLSRHKPFYYEKYLLNCFEYDFFL